MAKAGLVSDPRTSVTVHMSFSLPQGNFERQLPIV